MTKFTILPGFLDFWLVLTDRFSVSYLLPLISYHASSETEKMLMQKLVKHVIYIYIQKVKMENFKSR